MDDDLAKLQRQLEELHERVSKQFDAIEALSGQTLPPDVVSASLVGLQAQLFQITSTLPLLARFIRMAWHQEPVPATPEPRSN